MLRFAEEIMLLLLDDKGGKFADLPAPSVECALAGAVLMDLALEGRIDTDPERLFVVDPTPLQDPLLDPTLAWIAQSTETYDTRHWLEQTIAYASNIRDISLARLVERGILRRRMTVSCGCSRRDATRSSTTNPVQEVKLRIMGVCSAMKFPDARDIVIISLSDACGIFRGLLSSRELRGAAPRIEQIGKMDLIGREVSESVRHIESSLAIAMG